MKRRRVLIVLAVVAMAAAGVRLWPRQTAGAATPAECLDNYYESLKSGDVDKYLHCLGAAYRAEIGQRFFESARRSVKDVKNVVQRAGPVEDGPSLWVDVDEVRTEVVRRLRYHLRREGGGWVIAAIDPPRENPAPIRYGTPIGEEP